MNNENIDENGWYFSSLSLFTDNSEGITLITDNDNYDEKHRKLL